MRWLRVYFDPRLLFLDHTLKMAGKGQKVAADLSMLVKTSRGVEEVLMQKPVNACILLVLTYGIPAWWPGRIRKNCKEQTIQNGMENNCKKLNKAQNKALCAILPVWRTTLTVVLQKEAATPHIHYTLDNLCKLAALCIHKLEVQHPFRIRTNQANTIGNSYCLERLARKYSNEMEYLDLLHKLEQWKNNPFGSDSFLVTKGGKGDQEKAVVKFNSWLKGRKSLDMIAYIHGSQELDQNNILTGTRAEWILNLVGSWH